MSNIETSTNQEKSRLNLGTAIKTEWSGFSSNKKISFVLSILPVGIIFIPILWKNWTSNWIVNGINNIGNSWFQDLLNSIVWSLFRGNIKDGISINSMRVFYPILITILFSLIVLHIFLLFISFLPNSSKLVKNRLYDLLITDFGLQPSLAKVILILPLVITLIFSVSIAFPGTRFFAYTMLDENQPVEFFTFFFLLLASIQGFCLAVKNRKAKGDSIILLFYLLFSLSLFIVGMEEISWGQHFLGFDTPEIILSSNQQGEFTLHNLGGLQGMSEVFHILFALGGFVGIWLNSTTRFREIGVPFILVTWFITILVFAGLDLYNDFYSFSKVLHKSIREMAEVTEMLIGIAGSLYLWLINKRLNITKSLKTPRKTQSKLGVEIVSDWSELRSFQRFFYYLLILPASKLIFMLGWKKLFLSWIVRIVNNPGYIWLKVFLNKISWAIAMGSIKDEISSYHVKVLYPHLIVILITSSLLYFLLISLINLPNTRRLTMNTFRGAIKEELGSRPSISIGFLVFPVLVVTLFGICGAIPSIRAFCFMMVGENNPVEIITFLFFLVGSLLSFNLVLKTRKAKGDTLIWMFYLALALGLFYACLKEISWGQQFLSFKIPDPISSVNLQIEFNINNLRGSQKWRGIFHMLISLGGLIGLGIKPNSRFSELKVPFFLVTWFITILVMSTVIYYVIFIPFAKGIIWGFCEMAEIIELLIGISGFLYIWFINKRLSNK